MSLDVTLTAVRDSVVFESNITHNLNKMAEAAGIYKHLWRPEEIGMKLAGQLIVPLFDGLVALTEDPERFKKLNPENGWGNYDIFVAWVAKYLLACVNNPDAKIRVSR